MVLFSHNIAMVITMVRKTGGLLTKDDADFVDAGYCLETSLQQPPGGALRAQHCILIVRICTKNAIYQESTCSE